MELKTIVLQGLEISQSYKDTVDELSFPYSIEDIKKIISEKTKKKIDLYELEWNSSGTIKGKLCRYKSHGEIYFLTRDEKNPKITWCEQRFIATKEMAHLIIDTEESFTQDLDELIRSIVYPKPYINDHNEPMQSELFAEVVAAEILFPWEERDECIRSLEEFETKKIDIAEKYKLPLKTVDWVLNPDNHKAIGDIIKENN